MKIRYGFVSNSSSQSFIISLKSGTQPTINYKGGMNLVNKEIVIEDNPTNKSLIFNNTIKDLYIGDYIFDENDEYFNFLRDHVPNSLDDIIKKDLGEFMENSSKFYNTDLDVNNPIDITSKSFLKMSEIYLKYLSFYAKRIINKNSNIEFYDFMDKLNKMDIDEKILNKVSNYYDEFLSEDENKKLTEDVYLDKYIYPDSFIVEMLMCAGQFFIYELYSLYTNNIFEEIDIPYAHELYSYVDLLLYNTFFEDKCEYFFSKNFEIVC